MAKEENTLTIKHIDTAPIKPGEPFGPCLLSPGINRRWTTGGWDGDGWFTDDGDVELQPRQYALLPE